MRTDTTLIAAMVVAFTLAGPAGAQVVRESDVSSIAGILSPTQPTIRWTFKSAGNQVLFATLDADIYRLSREEGHETVTIAAEEPGGCSGEEGGPGTFYMAVLDSAGMQVGTCFAVRPAPPPGWQRDPRMACILPVTPGLVAYSIEIGLVPKDEHESTPLLVGAEQSFAFVLNVSLRNIAKNGAPLPVAVHQSTNDAPAQPDPPASSPPTRFPARP